LAVFPPQHIHPLATSALPDAPVVPVAPPRDPGRGRRAGAALLRRAADRLAADRGVLAA
jgi:hypothetical protein